MSCCLFTGVHVVHALTALAADITAPDELALTALDASHHMRVVSTAAAQEVAAVRAGGGAVAVPPPGADDTPPAVLQAVVWRLVEEDELLLVNREPMLILPGLPPGAVHYLNAMLVALLQVHAHILESGHHLPTRLHCTRAGDAMTAAVCGHGTADGLKTAEEKTDIKDPADDEPPNSQTESEGKQRPHLSSHLTVVLVHGAQCVSSSAHRGVFHHVVHELATEPGSILDVV